MSTRKGNKAEIAAERHLKMLGYDILDRNARLGKGELDIVASKDDILAFVEVKGHQRYESSLEAMHDDKCQRLISAAKVWLSKHPDYQDFQCRFDVMIVSPKTLFILPPMIEHIKDAFRLP
ncbi:MAG: YraN family protein [Zetaproteobacteria bacterium CG2_30_46_52]|nr:MAG: YraN family protein [Zetaproteobacteria bacterium CG2_30_46_52]